MNFPKFQIGNILCAGNDPERRFKITKVHTEYNPQRYDVVIVKTNNSFEGVGTKFTRQVMHGYILFSKGEGNGHKLTKVFR